MLNAIHTAPNTTPALPASAQANDGTAVRLALLLVLASDGFCKAQRMSRLLRFLVEKRLAGALDDTVEYAIGIGVFDRNPETYSTCDDPIVRVQVGRLRDKLKRYYANAGIHAALRFSIPVGSYMPKIELMQHIAPALGTNYLLSIAPLAFFTADPDGAAFTRGLNEELAYHLYNAFGQTIVSHTFDTCGTVGSSGISHRLEGSIRINGELVRASIRLIDRATGCIVWSEQFDCNAPFAIALQERLALRICRGLEQYFAIG